MLVKLEHKAHLSLACLIQLKPIEIFSFDEKVQVPLRLFGLEKFRDGETATLVRKNLFRPNDILSWDGIPMQLLKIQMLERMMK